MKREPKVTVFEQQCQALNWPNRPIVDEIHTLLFDEDGLRPIDMAILRCLAHTMFGALPEVPHGE